MRIRLTGIIEIQTEIETEIDEVEYYNWVGYKPSAEDSREMIVRYLEHCSDEAAEIWATAPRDLNNYEVLTADFVEAEVLDDCKN